MSIGKKYRVIGENGLEMNEGFLFEFRDLWRRKADIGSKRLSCVYCMDRIYSYII